MLASDVITRVRIILSDQDSANYRWPDPTLLLYLTDAIQDAVAKRPELALNASGVLLDFAGATALTDSILLEDKMRPALMDFVIHRTMVEDDADKANAVKAAFHYDKYLKGLYGE